MPIVSSVISFLRSNPTVRWVLVVVAALGVGYASGRWLQPPRVEEKVVTKVETRVEYRDRIVVQKAKARVVYRDVVKVVTVQPDGTRTETTTDHSRSDTRTASHADTTTTAASTTSGVSVASRITTARHSVRLAPMLGVGILGPNGLIRNVQGVAVTSPPLGPLWVGAEASGQIWGPLSLGGWTLTNGRDLTVGVSLGVEF